MIVKPKQLFLGILLTAIFFALQIFAALKYDYYSPFILEYFCSFIIIGYFIIYHIRNNYILSLEVVFNLYGLLYTNFFIGQHIIANKQIEFVYLYMMVLSHLSIIAFNVCNCLSKGKTTRNGLDPFSEERVRYSPRKLLLFTFMLFIMGVAVEYYVLFYRIGLLRYFSASRATKALLSTGYSVLSFYKFVIPVTTVVFLLIFLKYRIKFAIALFLGGFGICIFNSYISASRSEFLSVVLPIMSLLYMYKIIDNKKMITLGIAGVVLFGTWKSLLGGGTFRISFDGEFNTWYGICKNVLTDEDFRFRYGKSYLDTFYNMIVPLTNTEPLSEWHMKKFVYSVYEIGGGRGFSGVLEAYINFGIFGNILVYALYGKLVKKLTPDSDLKVIIYLIIMTSMHQFFRSESYSLWKNMMWFKIYPILVAFLLSRETSSYSRKDRNMTALISVKEKNVTSL